MTPQNMNRQHIVRRLLYLRNLEFINIFLLPVCLSIILTASKIKNWQPYTFGTFVICFILAQGVFYWHLKLRTIRQGEPALPSYFRPTFLFFKWSNIALLSVYLILMASSQALGFIDFQVSVGANGIFLFAILEYVNYYHYQLSHDSVNDLQYLIKHRRIRRSPLYIDLQRNEKRA